MIWIFKNHIIYLRLVKSLTTVDNTDITATRAI